MLRSLLWSLAGLKKSTSRKSGEDFLGGFCYRVSECCSKLARRASEFFGEFKLQKTCQFFLGVLK